MQYWQPDIYNSVIKIKLRIFNSQVMKIYFSNLINIISLLKKVTSVSMCFIESFQAHLNIARNAQDRAGMGRAFGNIGNAYSASGFFEQVKLTFLLPFFGSLYPFIHLSSVSFILWSCTLHIYFLCLLIIFFVAF